MCIWDWRMLFGLVLDVDFEVEELLVRIIFVVEGDEEVEFTGVNALLCGEEYIECGESFD